MDRKALERLRMDRRLVGRRGFASTDELASEADELPDVSEKAMPASGDGDEAAPAPSTPPESGA